MSVTDHRMVLRHVLTLWASFTFWRKGQVGPLPKFALSSDRGPGRHLGGVWWSSSLVPRCRSGAFARPNRRRTERRLVRLGGD